MAPNYGQERSYAHTSAAAYHGSVAQAYIGSFSERPTRSVRGIAGLERAYFSGGMPYGLYHEGYGTSVYVGLRYSERMRSPFSPQRTIYEVSGFASWQLRVPPQRVFTNVFGEMCFFRLFDSWL